MDFNVQSTSLPSEAEVAEEGGENERGEGLRRVEKKKKKKKKVSSWILTSRPNRTVSSQDRRRDRGVMKRQRTEEETEDRRRDRGQKKRQRTEEETEE